MKKLILYFSLVGFLFINSCTNPNIDQNIEKYFQNPNVTIIDIREADELITDGKIEQAIHIPKGEINNQIEKIKAMPKPIVFFCRSGNRVNKIIKLLKENNVEEIYNGGGLKDVKAVLEKNGK